MERRRSRLSGKVLDCDARRLYYRAPTEGDSSGSPVFDAEWRVWNVE